MEENVTREESVAEWRCNLKLKLGREILILYCCNHINCPPLIQISPGTLIETK